MIASGLWLAPLRIRRCWLSFALVAEVAATEVVGARLHAQFRLAREGQGPSAWTAHDTRTMAAQGPKETMHHRLVRAAAAWAALETQAARVKAVQ